MFLILKSNKREKVKITDVKLIREEKNDHIHHHSKISNDTHKIMVHYQEPEDGIFVNIIKNRMQNEFFLVGKITRRKASCN